MAETRAARAAHSSAPRDLRTCAASFRRSLLGSNLSPLTVKTYGDGRRLHTGVSVAAARLAATAALRARLVILAASCAED